MSSVSEIEMSIAFEKLVKSGEHLNGMPDLDLMYKEVACKQGIADFIGVNAKIDMGFFSSFNCGITLESGTLIFSLLKPKAPRSKRFLQEKTGLSEATVNRVIKELVSYDFIKNVGHELYVLSPVFVRPRVDIWAFELKLSNWRRALFQCLQYKAFANYSVVVFPIEKEHVLKKQLSLFKELNVGVLLFDITENNLRFLSRPKKEKSLSKWHTLFAIGKIANQYNFDCANNYAVVNKQK
ncbi:hypothetical protein SDC9_22231 [bioreactor metagenome]|uniref:Uncharacterized protein n=1 Tax=bioreactor metagenome TaxID=1076179 RepID=A0A644UBM0_9ZZZZ|nr:hypothetical protein [Acidaminococcaceae bacterium]